MARRAPAPDRPRAMARPISRRAPVTRAARPLRRKVAKGSGIVAPKGGNQALTIPGSPTRASVDLRAALGGTATVQLNVPIAGTVSTASTAEWTANFPSQGCFSDRQHHVDAISQGAAVSKASAVYEILRLLTPYDIDLGKIRVGNRLGDGGYVIADCLRPGQPVLSFGIGDDVSYDLQLAERGHPVFQFDHTVGGPPCAHPGFHFHRLGVAGHSDPKAGLYTIRKSLAAVLKVHSAPAILKIDVEGAEWQAFAAIDDE